MAESKTASIPTKQELHKLAYDLSLASMKNAFPGKKEEHLYAAAVSIATKISTSIDKLLSDVKRQIQ
jgi:hypothetical protein